MAANSNDKEKRAGFPIGKRQQVDEDPLNSDFSNATVPGDPVEHGSEKESAKTIGDDDTHLNDRKETGYIPVSPAAGSDGIRDGDLEANDDIGGDRLVTE
jgi:hypothetical protein